MNHSAPILPVSPRNTPSMPSRCPLRPVSPNTLQTQGIDKNMYIGEYRERIEENPVGIRSGKYRLLPTNFN